MNHKTVTREQLTELIYKYSKRHIHKNILRCAEQTFNKLLVRMNINVPSTPLWMRKDYPTISKTQKEFILGSLLGDGSIVLNGHQAALSISHSTAQRQYLEHKHIILGELSTKIHNTISKSHQIISNTRTTTIQETHGCILKSIVHPYFTDLRAKLYPAGTKVISDWWLNQITPISLAYWIMDDGSGNFSDNSYVINISTYSFTLEEHILIKEHLLQRFQIEMQIQPVSHGNGYSTRFRTKDSIKLRSLVQQYIPECMRYKIEG